MGSLRTLWADSVQSKQREELIRYFNRFPPLLLWDQGTLVLEDDLSYFDYHKWILHLMIIRQYVLSDLAIFSSSSKNLNQEIRVSKWSAEWDEIVKTGYLEHGFIDTTGLKYEDYYDYITALMKQWRRRGFALPWFCDVRIGSLWDYTKIISPDQIRNWLVYIGERSQES
jgi:hypothetical protein